MCGRDQGRNRAFSLIELIIVVVIIGIIAAIAIPRLSRGTAGAADSALIGDLAVLRSALDLYETEHTGSVPTLANYVAAMTQYTDIGGTTNATKSGAFIYGPYLRAIPPLPVGTAKGETVVKVPPADGVAGAGWVYDAATSTIIANCAAGETDDSGKPYISY